MHTEPLTAARYPDATDGTNLAQYYQNLAYDLAVNTCPRFATAALRDSAYAAYVSAGGVLKDGRSCYTDDSGYWDRVGGAWHLRAAAPALVAVSVSSGWTAVAGRVPVVGRDSAGFVNIMGAVTNNNTYTPNSGGPYQILQLPSGYWPSISTSILIPFGVNAFPMVGSVNPDGSVKVGNYGSSITAATSHAFDGVRFHPNYAGSVWP